MRGGEDSIGGTLLLQILQNLVNRSNAEPPWNSLRSESPVGIDPDVSLPACQQPVSSNF